MRRPDAQLPDFEYERRVLQQVSRSFALTIPQLPPALQRAVTNAYLVCRIVDTIEDEGSLSLDQKRFFFQDFIKVINGQASAQQFADALYPLLSGRTLPEERELIGNTPLVIRNTMTFSQKQQAAIKRCAIIMAQGMRAFQETKGLQGLKDLSDFNRYCYHVAGVVGELLTELFCEYSSEISRDREKLLPLAVSFGQGLQMTNIIKDLWEDRNHGACWLPQDVFQKVGCDLKNLFSGQYTDAFGQGLAVLIGLARVHLQDALAYTLMIPRHEPGIRRFCLWAIGMALLTLRKINKKRNYQSGQEVKISRRTLKAIILVTHVTLRSNFLLKRLFGLAARGLPLPAGMPGKPARMNADSK
jgi:farnesyl-diphosphate farnesyltransferase